MKRIFVLSDDKRYRNVEKNLFLSWNIECAFGAAVILSLRLSDIALLRRSVDETG